MTTSPRQQYRDLVAQVAAKAKLALPEQTNGRIEAACKLVLQGDVLPQEDGSIHVGSSDPAKYYVLTGQACTCVDYLQERAPSGWCKHRISAGIEKRVREVLAALPTPALAAPATHTEAPASVNCHITIAGRQAQLTLRDTDETRLLARLETVLQRYPLPEKTPDPTEGWCMVHHVSMRLNPGKDGKSSWYSHKTDRGWCKGKGVQP